MSLLVARHQFLTLERVLKIWYFSQNKYASCFWQKLCGFNHKRLTYVIMISLVILVELGIFIKHSSSNGCLYLQHRSHILWWKRAQNLIFCVNFESCCWHIWHGIDHKRPIYTIRKLFQPPLYYWGMLWNNRAALDVSPCSTSSHFLCWEGAQNLIWCMKCESCFW